MRKRPLPLWCSLLAALGLGFLAYVCGKSFLDLDYDWEFSFLLPYLYDADTGEPGMILTGLWLTIWMSFLSILFGSILGIGCGLCLLGEEPLLKASGRVFVDIFRNTPVLVQLYVIYFIVGTAIDLNPETAGVFCLSLFCAAYVAEIFRGTILEFEQGQIDAGLSLGLNRWQVARFIIAPQALRRMLPPLVGQFVTLVKDSSLVSVIAVNDLTKSALNIVAVSFRSFETWFVIALIYFALNSSLSSLGRTLEVKLRPKKT